MPAANVRYPLPLQRLNPFYPGQVGVPGAWTDTGERMHCTGTVFYVDPNHSDANDQRDGTDPIAPLATVAMALTKCQAFRGDIIAVMANDYWSYGHTSDYLLPVQEDVTVTVPGVRIVGVSPSGAMGVYWRPATVAGTCITVDAIDVLVEGFAFLGRAGGTGIAGEWDGVTVHGDNLTVRHCYFDENLDNGIVLDFVWYGDVHHNHFDACAAYGIYVDPATMGDPAYNAIHHNLFDDCGTSAISLRDGDRNHIYENYIYNYDAARQAGAPTNSMIDLTNGSRNQAHHNTLSCILPAAAAWDYNACNTAGTADAWTSNWLLDGPSVTNPA